MKRSIIAILFVFAFVVHFRMPMEHMWGGGYKSKKYEYITTSGDWIHCWDTYDVMSWPDDIYPSWAVKRVEKVDE